ncbi:hypothetical protein Tco_0521081 [Tanacetum coccineum]
MSTHQDIYAASSENRPPMLNKDNYVPWSSRLLSYAKIKPNGKLIYNSIMHSSYVRRMIPEAGDSDREVPVAETFHEQTDEELTEKEVKKMEADDQAIQIILMGLPEDIYAAIDSCETALEINQNGLIVVPGIANQNVNQNGNEAEIQLQAEELDLMVAAGDLDKIEKVNSNCILMANLQQASTSGTQTNNAPVYDDGSAKVQHSENCYDNDIFNMFTQEEHVEQSGRTVDQNPATVEETRAYFESLYNLAIESLYQEQCLTKKINALHLTSSKTITTLNEEITNLNNQLSKEMSTVSFLQEEKKKLKSDFKTRKDKLLDKQIQLENKIKELDNILVKTGQTIQTMHMLLPKPDSFSHTEQKMALGYQNPFYLKQAQQKQQSLYNGKVLLEKHDPPAVYDSEETLQLAQESKSREELYFLNTSKMASVSKIISIPNEEFSNDTSPSVAWKFLNETDTTKGTSVNTQFKKHSILGKPPSSSGSKLYFVTPLPKSKVLPKIDESNALSKPVTSNSAPSNRESKFVQNDKVIAPGIFRTHSLKNSRVDNFVPNKRVKESVRTKPITVSQPYVITKKEVNSNINGLPFIGVESTAKTRRP